MLCNVVTRGIVLLNFVQQCSMLCCVLACYAVLLHVTKIYYMVSSVVEFYLVIICCAVLLHVTKSYTCGAVLLHVFVTCYVIT